MSADFIQYLLCEKTTISPNISILKKVLCRLLLLLVVKTHNFGYYTVPLSALLPLQ
jgi:hypothetical protein